MLGTGRRPLPQLWKPRCFGRSNPREEEEEASPRRLTVLATMRAKRQDLSLVVVEMVELAAEEELVAIAEALAVQEVEISQAAIASPKIMRSIGPTHQGVIARGATGPSTVLISPFPTFSTPPRTLLRRREICST